MTPKRSFALALLLAAAPAPLLAAEGMWRPDQLPELAEDLAARGLELPAEQLADLNQWPMQAVISLGNCTASFVSPQGLVVTNHHCAYGSIQYNSDEENNYIADGFLAADMSGELPAAPGSRVYVTTAIEDVTDRVNAGLTDATPARERYQAVDDAQKALIAECEAPGGVRCQVASFNGGEEYRLVTRMEIKDVRLVYAPPESIGKFGGDIDNWMWPRHTGDFAFYRAYVGPDGKPADYAAENVPYRPESWLKVSGSGLQEGDFVMAAGYPGSTSRYARLSEVEQAFGWSYPLYRRIYQGQVDAIEAAADEESEQIAYASLLAGLNNSIKNYDGQMEGAARVDLAGRRAAREAELDAWIAADPQRAALYADAIANMDAEVARQAENREREFWYYQVTGSTLIETAIVLYRLALEGEKPDAEREPGYQERDLTFFREDMEQIERRFDADVDLAIWMYLLDEYLTAGPQARIAEVDEVLGLSAGEPREARAARLAGYFADTELATTEGRLAWMEKSPDDFRNSADPFLRLAVALFDIEMAMEEEWKTESGAMLALTPKYMEAITAWQASLGRPAYPDANSTLRVTYGEVSPACPRDGLCYTAFTSLQGIVEKATGEAPFDAPEAQLHAIERETYGYYAEGWLGSVPVNFLTTLDITGGNSGSPTLNARGELVGLLFDGTYESVNSDWDFAEAITRSIAVDSRYMLWTMDYISGADWLIDEMDVVQ